MKRTKAKRRRQAAPPNHIPLTVDTLRAAYEFLRTTPPFVTWNLPDGEDIEFRVSKDPHNAAWHTSSGRGVTRKHTIAVSSRCVGHTASLIAAIAHETVHLHMAITGMDRGAGEHGAAFYKISAAVCRIHGLDPKSF